MLTHKRVIAGAAGALLIAAGSLPAAAQYAPYENCGDLYNRTMATYQTYGPQSPQYAQMLDYYGARCLAGSSAPPVYSYVQPAPIAPGAAIVGGIIGGVVGGALSDHRRDDRWDRRRDHWRH